MKIFYGSNISFGFPYLPKTTLTLENAAIGGTDGAFIEMLNATYWVSLARFTPLFQRVEKLSVFIIVQ